MNKTAYIGKTISKANLNRHLLTRKEIGTMRKRGKGGLNREQIIMLSASGFVIMALTLTGVYVSKKADNNKGDGYSIDLSSLVSDFRKAMGATGEAHHAI